MGAHIANAHPAGVKNRTGGGPDALAWRLPSRRPTEETAFVFIAQAVAVSTF